jgi:hypothetical protein
MFNELVEADYETAALIGLFAWLLANYLTEQGEILSWWRLYVLDRLPARVRQPLGGCAMCTAGFWTIVIKVIHIIPFISFSFSIICFYVAYVAASGVIAMGVAIALTKLLPNE